MYPRRVETLTRGTKEDVVTRYVESFSTHQRLLYEIIAETGEIGSVHLHAEYERRATNPKAKSTRRQYRQTMCREEMIEAEGNGRGRKCRIVDY